MDTGNHDVEQDVHDCVLQNQGKLMIKIKCVFCANYVLRLKICIRCVESTQQLQR